MVDDGGTQSSEQLTVVRPAEASPAEARGAGGDELRAAILALGAVVLIVVVAVIALVVGSEDTALATGVASVATGALTVIGTIVGVFGGHRLGAAGKQESETARLQAERALEHEQNTRMRATIRGYMVENRLSTEDRAAATAEADDLATRLGLAPQPPVEP